MLQKAINYKIKNQILIHKKIQTHDLEVEGKQVEINCFNSNRAFYPILWYT